MLYKRTPPSETTKLSCAIFSSFGLSVLFHYILFLKVVNVDICYQREEKAEAIRREILEAKALAKKQAEEEGNYLNNSGEDIGKREENKVVQGKSVK